MAEMGPRTSMLWKLTWYSFLLLFPCSVQVTGKLMESSEMLNTSAVQNDVPSKENERMGCINWEGKPVADGEKYSPNLEDICMQCLCENRFAVLCQAVACSAPSNCPDAKPIPGKCCEYECGFTSENGNGTGIGKDPTRDAEESITNLSLRLIASTVTSLLFLALLLFMVYRLRQRRLLLAMRRYEARSRISNNEDSDSEHYIPDTLLSLECPPYTDPPPPYSPPKPPHIFHGELPPPYEEINTTENLAGERSAERTPGNEVNAGSEVNSQSQSSQSTRERELPQLHSEMQGQNLARPPVDTLPAYASTDVVQGLDSMYSTRAPALQRSWGDWHTSGQELQIGQRSSSNDNRQGYVNGSFRHQRSFDRPANERHSMPTMTAFQRFSSLFKRNIPKSKDRNTQPRPVSECRHPTQYATMPYNSHNSNPSNGANLSNTGRRAQSNARSSTRSFTNRMCFSYDSARAAYELAAMSPSTSSNSSSSGGLASCSPRRETAQQHPLHSQLFQDDLRRHLPPLQTSDSLEFMTQASPGTCPSTLSPSSSSNNQSQIYHHRLREDHEQQACSDLTPPPNQVRDNNKALCENREVQASIVYDLTGSLAGLSSSTQLQLPDRPEQRQGCTIFHPPLGIHRTSSIPQNSLTDSSDSPPSREQDSHSINSNEENSRSIDNKTPSPLVLGAMRRSQSGISETSMFSVCSETGEKKLRDGRSSTDPKVLASDSQYPEHHSLSRLKPGTLTQKQESQFLKHTSPAAKSSEESNSLNSSTSSNGSCHRGEISDTSQVPVMFQVPHCQNIQVEIDGVEKDSFISSQEPQSQGDINGACFQENNLNKGIINQNISNSSNLIPTMLNIRPSSPFVTAQSAQLIPVTAERSKHHNSTETDTRGVADIKYKHAESKKIKKKKNRDKNQFEPSPQHHLHQNFKPMTIDHNDNGSHLMKSDVPCRDMPPRATSKLRSSRGGEKRKRTVSTFAPPYENPDSVPVNWMMSRSYDSSNINGYGNADVYRSHGADASVPSSILKEYSQSQGFSDNKSSRQNFNLPFGQSFFSPADGTTLEPKPGHGDKANQPSSTKKKQTHRRQASAEDRISNTGASSHQHHHNHLRSKSLACTADRGYGCKGESEFSLMEHGHSKSKGAKSGFGNDMNLDDQMGMIDFFNHGVDYSATKTSCKGNDSYQPMPSNSRSHSRGTTETGNQYQHGNSRSGLSSDLSFVNGSCPATEKGKKRASLPSLPNFSGQSLAVVNQCVNSLSGKTEGRVEREERHRNSLPENSHSHATSYV